MTEDGIIGLVYGPPERLPIYQVIVSGNEVLPPQRIDEVPFAETGYSTFYFPTYTIGSVYNFYEYWDAYRFYVQRKHIVDKVRTDNGT